MDLKAIKLCISQLDHAGSESDINFAALAMVFEKQANEVRKFVEFTS